MRLIISLFIFIFIFSCNKDAQPKEVSIFIIKSDSLIAKGKYVTAVSYLKTFKENNLLSQIDNAYLYYKTGSAYQLCTQVDSAKHYFKIADKIADKTQLSSLLFLKSHYKASSFFNKRNIDSSIVYALDAMNYAESTNEKHQFIANYDLAQIFLRENNIEKSRLYINKSLELSKAINDSLTLMKAELLEAEHLALIGKGDSSITKIKNVIRHCDKKGLTALNFRANSILNKVYFTKGMFQEAINSGGKTMGLINKIETCSTLDKLVSDLDKLKADGAENVMDKLESFDKNMNDLRGQITAKQTKINFLKGSNNASDLKDIDLNSELISTTNELIKLKDSLNNFSLKQKYLEYETKYQTKQKEKENLQLKADKVQQDLIISQNKNQKYALGLASILLGFSLLGLYIYSKRRKEKLTQNMRFSVIKARQEQNNILADDLHDTKAKDLYGIEVYLQNNNMPEVASRIKTIRTAIRNISHEITRISFDKSELNEQLKSLKSLLESDDFNINYVGLNEIDWKSILDVVKENLFIVIRESIANAKEHSKASLVNITFSQEKKHLKVTVTDNGDGLSKDYKKGKGLTNIELRIKEVNGSVSVKNLAKKGLSLHFDIVLT